MTDKEFDHLCEANSFGAVARNEFPLVPRAMLKALVDAAVATEILKQQDRIKRLEEAGDAMDKTAEPFVLDTIDEEIPMSDVGEQYEITYDSPPTAGDHVAMDRARKQWRKAKEAKP